MQTKLKNLEDAENLNDLEVSGYLALKKFAEDNGYEVSEFYRGRNFVKSHVAGRYEVWFATKYSNSKLGIGDTLKEAVLNAEPSIKECIADSIYEPKNKK